MSKGSTRRPQKISQDELKANWDRIFKDSKKVDQSASKATRSQAVE